MNDMSTQHPNMPGRVPTPYESLRSRLMSEIACRPSNVPDGLFVTNIQCRVRDQLDEIESFLTDATRRLKQAEDFVSDLTRQVNESAPESPLLPLLKELKESHESIENEIDCADDVCGSATDSIDSTVTISYSITMVEQIRELANQCDVSTEAGRGELRGMIAVLNEIGLSALMVDPT